MRREQRAVVLMRRMMSTSTPFSSLACSSGDCFSAFFSGRTAPPPALRSRRSSKSSAMLFPIASKSTGGEFSSFLNFGRRRFRGQEERRFGGGLCKENTTKYNTTTHLQKRGFVLASSNGIQNNNEQLKLFSVSSSLL